MLSSSSSNVTVGALNAHVRGVNLNYLEGGPADGPPILLWHGFLSTSYAWRHVMPALIQAGYHVLSPDMRGYGDSDKPPGTTGYDGLALMEDFRDLVHQLNFGKGSPITIAAHDMGAPPALLWAAHYPHEVAGLLYIEVPVMLSQVLTKIIAYTPDAMKTGSMWWWILPLAPDVPERLVVGNERAFLTWFYERHCVKPDAIDSATISEYLRTYSGRENVLGAMGVYRAAFTTIEQTEPLLKNKVTVPVKAIGGEKSLGSRVYEMVSLVAENVEQVLIPNCGHFLPEEGPDEIVQQIQQMVTKHE